MIYKSMIFVENSILHANDGPYHNLKKTRALGLNILILNESLSINSDFANIYDCHGYSRLINVELDEKVLKRSIKVIIEIIIESVRQEVVKTKDFRDK